MFDRGFIKAVRPVNQQITGRELEEQFLGNACGGLSCGQHQPNDAWRFECVEQGIERIGTIEAGLAF